MKKENISSQGLWPSMYPFLSFPFVKQNQHKTEHQNQQKTRKKKKKQNKNNKSKNINSKQNN